MTEVTTNTTDPWYHRYHPNPNPYPNPNQSYYCFSLLLYVYLILLHIPPTPVSRRSVLLRVGGDFSHIGC